jgi:hypothetical protein
LLGLTEVRATPPCARNYEHKRGERGGIAVTHLSVCLSHRHINKFFASANDYNTQTPEYAR